MTVVADMQEKLQEKLIVVQKKSPAEAGLFNAE